MINGKSHLIFSSASYETKISSHKARDFSAFGKSLNTQLFFWYQRETHIGRRLPTVVFYRETRWWNTWSDIPTKGVFFFFPGLSGFFFPHYTRVRRHPKPATGNITAKARRRSIGPQKAFMTDKLFYYRLSSNIHHHN